MISTTVQIIQAGDALAIELPEEMLTHLQAKIGDTLTLTETPSGVRLSHLDEAQRRQLEIAERIMREDRELLRKLAE